MSITSLQTYARSFSADLEHSSVRKAAGNYENSIAAKIAKGIVGVLTLGIGYGIIRLVEEFCIAQPKMNEFCSNAPGIYNALGSAIKAQKNTVEVKLQDGRELKFTQVGDCEKGRHTVISDGVNEEVVECSLVEILERLGEDFKSAPGYYGIHLGSMKYQEFYGTIENRQAAENLYSNVDVTMLKRSECMDAQMTQLEGKPRMVSVPVGGGSHIEFRNKMTMSSGESPADTKLGWKDFKVNQSENILVAQHQTTELNVSTLVLNNATHQKLSSDLHNRAADFVVHVHDIMFEKETVDSQRQNEVFNFKANVEEREELFWVDQELDNRLKEMDGNGWGFFLMGIAKVLLFEVKGANLEGKIKNNNGRDIGFIDLEYADIERIDIRSIDHIVSRADKFKDDNENQVSDWVINELDVIKKLYAEIKM